MIVTGLCKLCTYKKRPHFRLRWGYIETTFMATMCYVWMLY